MDNMKAPKEKSDHLDWWLAAVLVTNPTPSMLADGQK